MFNFELHILRQRNFSAKAFGPGKRHKGITNHIRDELREIEENPEDLEEWVDVIQLAIDGAWRQGYSPRQITQAMKGKLDKNEARQWPDWKQTHEDQPIKHIK